MIHATRWFINVAPLRHMHAKILLPMMAAHRRRVSLATATATLGSTPGGAVGTLVIAAPVLAFPGAQDDAHTPAGLPRTRAKTRGLTQQLRRPRQLRGVRPQRLLAQTAGWQVCSGIV